jgi:hypothetical protein
LASPYIYICREEIKWMRNYRHIIYIYARRKRERGKREELPSIQARGKDDGGFISRVMHTHASAGEH